MFRYTIQEVLTFNVWQLYEQMVGPLYFFYLYLKERSKMLETEKRFWPLTFKVDEDKLKIVKYI